MWNTVGGQKGVLILCTKSSLEWRGKLYLPISNQCQASDYHQYWRTDFFLPGTAVDSILNAIHDGCLVWWLLWGAPSPRPSLS